MNTSDTTLKELKASTTKYTAVISAVIGFCADVLSPIAPFAKALFFISLIITVVCGCLWFFGRRAQMKKSPTNNAEKNEAASSPSRLLRLAVFFSIATPILGVVSLLNATGGERGFLGDQVPAIANMQNSLMKIEEGVTRIEKGVDKVSDQVSGVDDKIVDIQAGVKDINKGMDSVKKLGGLVADPKNPRDWLNNARQYHEEGFYSKSIEAYEKYFEFGELPLEPYLEYRDIVLGREGRSSAIGKFNEMYKTNSNVHSQLMAITLVPYLKNQIEYMKNLVEKHPDFVPGPIVLCRYYFLAALERNILDQKLYTSLKVTQRTPSKEKKKKGLETKQRNARDMSYGARDMVHVINQTIMLAKGVEPVIKFDDMKIKKIMDKLDCKELEQRILSFRKTKQISAEDESFLNGEKEKYTALRKKYETEKTTYHNEIRKLEGKKVFTDIDDSERAFKEMDVNSNAQLDEAKKHLLSVSIYREMRGQRLKAFQAQEERKKLHQQLQFDKLDAYFLYPNNAEKMKSNFNQHQPDFEASLSKWNEWRNSQTDEELQEISDYVQELLAHPYYEGMENIQGLKNPF